MGGRSFDWAGAWVAIPLGIIPFLLAVHGGPLFIDDAYITFRYAENIARGRGFAWNSEPVLGTTTPLYCLILALMRALGVPVGVAAFWIGATCGALAPILLWSLGGGARRTGAGVLAGALLSLLPFWWLMAKSGMETTLAGVLVLCTILLHQRGKIAASGLIAGLLVLVRPDTAALPALVLAPVLLRDRRRAGIFLAAACALPVLWAVYGLLTFGSPIPHSLPAKRLIHSMPWYPIAGRLIVDILWPGNPAVAALMAALWVLGAAAVLRSLRERWLTVVWPPVFLASLAATGIGPFFWYPAPALPLVFLVASHGVLALRGALGARWGRGVVLVPALLSGSALIPALPWILDPARQQKFVEKEMILGEMADRIRERCREAGLDPSRTPVYVGEVGVLGYHLLDFPVLDSSGINSPEILEILERRLRAPSGSRGWSLEAVRRLRPRFIATFVNYAELAALRDDPEFRMAYALLATWSGPPGEFVLLERRPP